jgi:hypothetical protein
MDNSIIPIIKELERVYDELSKEFGLKAKRPIITIQTKGRSKGILGWHWSDKWQNGKEDVSEINICAENLKDTPIETLVHEMVHHANAVEKIEDCNHHAYHNKHFKKRAESYGLNVENGDRHGWAHTSIGTKLAETLKKINVNYEVFKLYRKPNLSTTAPTKMRKFSCGCTTVRCATDLDAVCNRCKNRFVEAI